MHTRLDIARMKLTKYIRRVLCSCQIVLNDIEHDDVTITEKDVLILKHQGSVVLRNSEYFGELLFKK